MRLDCSKVLHDLASAVPMGVSRVNTRTFRYLSEPLKGPSADHVYLYSAFNSGNNSTALYHVGVIVDPLSETAQKWSSVIEVGNSVGHDVNDHAHEVENYSGCGTSQTSTLRFISIPPKRKRYVNWLAEAFFDRSNSDNQG